VVERRRIIQNDIEYAFLRYVFPGGMSIKYHINLSVLFTMTFEVTVCTLRILHLGGCNTGCTYILGDERLECSPAERGLGVFV